jgi:DMSO/TMAO reductase YedYZ molybdopterin-dependent catalytic subunit
MTFGRWRGLRGTLEQFSSGAHLPIPHGAPLRLRFERQLGYKMAKYVMRIEAMDGSPAWRPRRLLGRSRRDLCGLTAAGVWRGRRWPAVR